MGAAALGNSVGIIVAAIAAVFLLLFLLLLYLIHVDEIAEGVHVHCVDLLFPRQHEGEIWFLFLFTTCYNYLTDFY